MKEMKLSPSSNAISAFLHKIEAKQEKNVVELKADARTGPSDGERDSKVIEEYFLSEEMVFVRCRTAGTGRRILLLHEWGESMESVTPIFDDFVSSYEVTAVDFPGHGFSGVPPSPWNLEDFANCVLRLMDRLLMERPDIIGHSFGGRVALRLASRHPAESEAWF